MIISIIKEPDDPTCLRISAGGFAEHGYYLVFRGDKDKIISCMETLLDVLKRGAPINDRSQSEKGEDR